MQGCTSHKKNGTGWKVEMIKKSMGITVYAQLTVKAYKLIPRKLLLLLLLQLLLSIVFALLQTSGNIVFRYLSDAAYEINKTGLENVILILLIFFAVSLVNNLIWGVNEWFFGYANGKTEEEKTRLIAMKCEKLPLENFEVPELYDVIQRARDAPLYAVFSVAITTILFVVRIASVNIYLWFQQPLLAVFLTIFIIPSSIAYIIRGNRMFQLDYEQSPKKREMKHYHECLYNKKYLKETRVLAADKFFYNKWHELLKKVIKEEWQTNLGNGLLMFGTNALKNCGFIATIAFAGYLFYKQQITIGVFSMTIMAMRQLSWVMEELVKRLGTGYERVIKTKNLHDFLELCDEKNKGDVIENISTISLEKVSYRYPLSQRNALDEVNLTIYNGERIAIVGKNGAGKSTLVKLITGLLQPTYGRILVSGKDLDDCDKISYRNHISAVYQNYNKYNMTIRENITLADPGRTEADREIAEILHKVGFSPELKNGLDTMLGADFAGVEFSGGEWQKIAIARGIFKKHDIIILDEPSASLDPLAESEIISRLIEMSDGKIAIIVTHRLNCTPLMDKIYVMDDGRIVESGTHEELMSRKGLYADMYNLQAGWYQ